MAFMMSKKKNILLFYLDSILLKTVDDHKGFFTDHTTIFKINNRFFQEYIEPAAVSPPIDTVGIRNQAKLS